jgi:hypothetical protein
MSRRTLHLRLRWWLTAAGVVVLCLAGALVVLAADSDSDLGAADRDAISSTVQRYLEACADTYVVPKQLQSEILAQRQALLNDGTPVQLDATLMDGIDSSYEAALRSLTTPALAEHQLELRTEHGLCAAATLEKALNRKDLSPLLCEDFKVVGLEPAGRSEGVARVKVTIWIGDTRADGTRLESWAVYTDTMVQQDGFWKIDNQLETWAYFDADSDQWGPDSPHDEGESTTDQ